MRQTQKQSVPNDDDDGFGTCTYPSSAVCWLLNAKLHTISSAFASQNSCRTMDLPPFPPPFLPFAASTIASRPCLHETSLFLLMNSADGPSEILPLLGKGNGSWNRLHLCHTSTNSCCLPDRLCMLRQTQEMPQMPTWMTHHRSSQVLVRHPCNSPETTHSLSQALLAGGEWRMYTGCFGNSQMMPHLVCSRQRGQAGSWGGGITYPNGCLSPEAGAATKSWLGPALAAVHAEADFGGAWEPAGVVPFPSPASKALFLAARSLRRTCVRTKSTA